jgi:hypothetical protein
MRGRIFAITSTVAAIGIVACGGGNGDDQTDNRPVVKHQTQDARRVAATREQERARARRVARSARRAQARRRADARAQRRMARAQRRALARSTPENAPGDDCAEGYDPCVPLYPPDVDCASLNGPYTVEGPDPHRLDPDGDGRAC